MMAFLNQVQAFMMLAPLFTVSYTAYKIIQIALLVMMVISALFIIVVVLFQPSNSSGVGAITGSSETFFSKNKSKTLAGKLKKWTVIALAVIIVFSILFFLVNSNILIGTGPITQ